MNARNYFCRKVWVWMQESWESGKVGVIFSSLAFHVSHPNCPLLLSDFGCPKSPLLISSSWLHQTESPALFLYSFFFVFVFFSLCSYTAASLSHQNKVSLSKEEIKGLTLKFQLPSLWVSNQNFIWLFLFLYLLSLF